MARTIVPKIQNLLTYSEDFTNAAWTKVNLTASSNTSTSPDGTTTADTLTDSTDGGLTSHYISYPTSLAVGILYTASIYLKAGTKQYVAIWADGGGAVCYVDLTTGLIISSSGSSIVGVAESVATTNGFYRVKLTWRGSAITTTTLRVYVSNDGTSLTYTGNGTGTVLVWGAQVVQANWAGPYQPTTSTAVNNGPIRSIAPKTQNLAKDSQDFTTANWTKGATTITPNATIAPDGTLTADLIDDGVATSPHYVNTITTGIAALGTAGIFTGSAYFKPIAGCSYGLTFSTTTSSGIGIVIDGATNTYVGTTSVGTALTLLSYSIEPANNGFYRITIKVSSTAPILNMGLFVNYSKTLAWGWSQTGANHQIYAWGAQITQGLGNQDYVATGSDVIGGGGIRNVVPKTQNLFLYSEQFDNAAWAKAGGVVAAPTVTANQATAPDGTLTADKIDFPIVTGASAYSVLFQSIITGQNSRCSTSVYLRGEAGGETIYINVQGFTKTTTCVLTTAWQRFEVADFNNTGSGTIEFGVDLRNGVNTAKGAQTVYIWGALANQANVSSPYVLTTATAINNGSIRSIPPKVQNLAVYSEQFDAIQYGKANMSVTPNTVINPVDGALTADSFVEDGVNTTHFMYQSYSFTPGATYNVSIYAKAGSRDWIVLYVNPESLGCYYNVATGVKGADNYGTGQIQSMGNGWYRCSLTFKAVASSSISIYSAISNGAAAYQGTSSTSLYLYGFQVSQSNFLLPYQTTTATAVNTGVVRQKA